jgi:ferredoxin-NADP reductase
VSVKREDHGAAGAYVDDKLQVGDIVQASAARGSFTLRPGYTPVVLLSAGIGVTPVLAMLHALAGEASTREIWWLYGTRNGREHPFAGETRGLLNALAHPSQPHLLQLARSRGSAQRRFRRSRAAKYESASAA